VLYCAVLCYVVTDAPMLIATMMAVVLMMPVMAMMNDECGGCDRFRSAVLCSALLCFILPVTLRMRFTFAQ
jgi:hypothetical protein